MGKGTIDQRPNGKFRLRVAINRKRETFTFDTEQEALAFQEELDTEKSKRKAGTYSITTLGEQYLDHRELDGVANIKTDRQRWNTHIKDAPFADWPLHKISAKDVREWLKLLAKKKLSHKWKQERNQKTISKATVRHCLNLFRTFLQWCVEQEYIDMNVARGIHVQKDAETVDKWTYLSPEEQENLFSVVPSEWLPVVQLAIGTGVRLGEMYGLRLGDVNLDSEYPHLTVRYGGPRSARWPNGKPTKTRRSRRVELFGLGLAGAQALVARHPDKEQSLAHKRQVALVCSPEPIKGSKDATKAPPANPWREYRTKRPPRQWSTWLDLLDLGRPLRWHDLRHTCASSLVSGWWGRVWSLDEIKEQLGHTTIATTQRYAHVGETARKIAAKHTGFWSGPKTGPELVPASEQTNRSANISK